MTKSKAKEPQRRIAWGRYLLLFFIAAWMFFLGVMVGRGTAPVRFDIQALQKELATLRDTVVRNEQAAMETALRGEDEKAAFGFYEALEKDGPDTAGPDVPAHRDAPADSATVPHKAPAAIMAKKKGVTGEPDAGATPAKRQPQAASSGNLTIQVASLKEAEAARQVVAKLVKEGYPAYLSKRNIADQAWYRVQVGRYENRQQAAADMDRLTKAQLEPILVRAQP